MKVLLDFGHCLSGADRGAVSNGRREEDCTREIGSKVKSKLEALGHSALVCSPDSANSLSESLEYRVNTANKATGDLFVSIHLNAGGGNGTEIYTFAGKQLQETLSILSNFENLGFNNRGIKDGSRLYVIKNTNMKAMLLECCFIDSSDMEKYDAEAFAKAMVKGITGKLPSVQAEQTITAGHVTAKALNVRSAPGVNNSIIGVLRFGDAVKIDKKLGNWYSIYFGQHGGYVYSAYIE